MRNMQKVVVNWILFQMPGGFFPDEGLSRCMEEPCQMNDSHQVLVLYLYLSICQHSRFLKILNRVAKLGSSNVNFEYVVQFKFRICASDAKIAK